MPSMGPRERSTSASSFLAASRASSSRLTSSPTMSGSDWSPAMSLYMKNSNETQIVFLMRPKPWHAPEFRSWKLSCPLVWSGSAKFRQNKSCGGDHSSCYFDAKISRAIDYCTNSRDICQRSVERLWTCLLPVDPRCILSAAEISNFTVFVKLVITWSRISCSVVVVAPN